MQAWHSAPANEFAGRRPRLAAAWVVCLPLALAPLLSHAQSVGNPHGVHVAPAAPDSSGAPDLDAGTAESAQEAERMRRLNVDRQRSMVSDTNKLFRLVGELNAEIGAGGENGLTARELHQLGEIEKLARNVRGKMTASMAPGPIYTPPLFPARPFPEQ